MGKMNFAGIKLGVAIFFTILPFTGRSQTSLPEPLLKGSVREQMDYIQEKTRIYEDYRAIREDMFQQLKKNAIDTLRAAKAEINSLKNNSNQLNLTIDSLGDSIETLQNNLDHMVKTKNSISLFGLEINKTAYNGVMWTIIVVLAALLGIGFLAFKRNRAVTIQTRKEIEELKREFEAYRKASREAREKMSMAHFNELKKLRGA
jgi:FtsZ-binding cell division protein ZapB